MINLGEDAIYFHTGNSNMPNDGSLTDEEKAILVNAGWRFLNENYIYIPHDYDGCMAFGIRNIRRVLGKIQSKQQILESG